MEDEIKFMEFVGYVLAGVFTVMAITAFVVIASSYVLDKSSHYCSSYDSKRDMCVQYSYRNNQK